MSYHKYISSNIVLAVFLTSLGCSKAKNVHRDIEPNQEQGEVNLLQLDSEVNIQGDVLKSEDGLFRLTRNYSLHLPKDLALQTRTSSVFSGCGKVHASFAVYQGQNPIDSLDMNDDQSKAAFLKILPAGDYLLIATVALDQECKDQGFFYNFYLEQPTDIALAPEAPNPEQHSEAPKAPETPAPTPAPAPVPAETPVPAPPKCPPNYVWVPGNPTPGLGSIANLNGVAPFCVAKFEMKHPIDATGWDEQKRDNYAVPVSQPQHHPWSWITRNEARAACERVKIPGFTVALISNSEWQTVARNIEATDANWSGGKVGEGKLARGHSDARPQFDLPIAAVDDPYDGTGNSADSGWEQKRTQQLSTGEVVWDIAGNVFEWVYEDVRDLGADFQNFGDQEFTTLSERNRALFGPLGNFGRDANAGYFDSSRSDGVERGGWSYSDKWSGIFLTSFDYSNHATPEIGFRCVARPSP